MTAERVPAVGGERTVPAPDPIARDYLLLALRLGQRIHGLIDGYFGPADLKAQADIEQLRAPEALAGDAATLRERVAAEVAEPDRRDWLSRQLVALETQARRLAGETPGYVEEAQRLFDRGPRWRDDSVFDGAAAAIDTLLPGAGTVAERLAEWDVGLEIDEERLPELVGWLVERYRERAAGLFGLPAGESFRVAFVRRRPWSGYNWYEGGLRSRFDLNLDLPVRAPSLLRVVAHETYPGHHLEHAWKEADLVERQGRLEASILLINAPECLVSEGLAEVAYRFAVPRAEEPEALAELLSRAAVPALRGVRPDDVAGRAVGLAAARRTLDAIAVNAALLRHAEERSHDDVLDYLVRVGRMEPGRAAKRLEFIEDPLLRSYVFVYTDGEELLDRWLATVPDPARADRFGRLLHEQLTPSAIEREIAAGEPAVSGPTTTR
jgi:hypothetical protein